MIRHICMFTFNKDKREESIAEFFERAEDLRQIDVIRRFEVVRGADGRPESNYDAALIFDFNSAEELDEYRRAEPHVEFGKFVHSIMLSRACIDYELD